MLMELQHLEIDAQNRRQKPRTRLQGQLMLRASDYRFRWASAIEHSERGARLVTDEPLEPGQLVELMVRTASHSLTRWARVAWVTPIGAGSSQIAGFAYF